MMNKLSSTSLVGTNLLQQLASGKLSTAPAPT